MKKLSVASLMLGLIMLAGCATMNQEQAQNLSEQGKAAYEQRDYAQALQLFSTAAEQGNSPSAQYYLGIMNDFGRGMPINHEKAVEWYIKAANQGHGYAMFNLAVSYEDGEGVAKDLERAFHWYSQGATAGNTDAMFNLAIMYDEGSWVNEDPVKAFALFKTVAESGDADGQYELGMMYAKGRGIERDAEQARYWLQQAADQGKGVAFRELQSLQ